MEKNNKVIEICSHTINKGFVTLDYSKFLENSFNDNFKVRFFGPRGLSIKGITEFVYTFSKKTILKTDTSIISDNYIVFDIEKCKINKYYYPPKETTDTSLCVATKLAKEVLDKSDKKGLEKYGMLLDDNLKDNFLVHAKEEAGDLLKYLVHVEEHFKNLCLNHPNDQELGKIIRKIYG